MERNLLNLLAENLKEVSDVVGVYFFGSRQAGWSKRHNRPPLPDSDWDIGIIHNGRQISANVLEVITIRSGVQTENIDFVQRSQMAATGGDFKNGLFSQDTVVYEILAGEKL